MSNVKTAIVLRCAAAGVSILSPHTALDNCSDGINDWLISAVRMHGVKQVTAVSPFNDVLVQMLEKQGHKGALGVGRMARLARPQQLGTIVQNIKDFTRLTNVRVAVPSAYHSDWKSFSVTSVAVCAGSGSSVLEAANADLLFTGEMSHHDVLAANARGCAVVLCEHSNTERGFLAGAFLEKLKSVINADGEIAVSVISSVADKDPLFIV
ncbi:NGG1 interacting factor [Chytriomyces hyalinus]|nr:NGG1 interacting factor [Chytriomyces hyalinus]